MPAQSSDKQPKPKRKAGGRPFVAGQSGNPGGKPKEIREIAALARELAPECIERLAFWMRSDNPKASVAAANVLLDRGCGKAPIKLDDGDKDGALVVQIMRLSGAGGKVIDAD